MSDHWEESLKKEHCQDDPARRRVVLSRAKRPTRRPLGGPPWALRKKYVPAQRHVELGGRGEETHTQACLSHGGGNKAYPVPCSAG